MTARALALVATAAVLVIGFVPASALGASERSRAASRPPITDRYGASRAPRESFTPSTAEPFGANGLIGPPCAEQLHTGAEKTCSTPVDPGVSAYAIDINVNTGLLGIGEGALLNAVQALLVQPIWLVLVWSVRAATVILEWCFSLDPFSAEFTSRLGSGLRSVESLVTYPALGFALACAAVLAAYHGVLRRRAGYAVGGALASAAMIVATLAVSAQPAATVGAVVNESNRLSASTLAAASGALGGNPTLHQALSSLDARLLEAPWCYLEFGNVSWCTSPPASDRPLERAALAVAAESVLTAGCRRGRHGVSCRNGNGPLSVVDAVEESRTVGSLFLAFPAGGRRETTPNGRPRFSMRSAAAVTSRTVGRQRRRRQNFVRRQGRGRDSAVCF